MTQQIGVSILTHAHTHIYAYAYTHTYIYILLLLLRVFICHSATNHHQNHFKPISEIRHISVTAFFHPQSVINPTFLRFNLDSVQVHPLPPIPGPGYADEMEWLKDLFTLNGLMTLGGYMVILYLIQYHFTRLDEMHSRLKRIEKRLEDQD